MTVSSASPRIQTIRHLILPPSPPRWPGVGNLHVSDDLVPGETFPERPHGLHPLALDQGGPGLNPVRATTDRFICDLYRALDLEEIERHLENRCCHTVLYG